MKNILVPIDGSTPSLQALEHAVDIANAYGAELTLVNITNADAVLDEFDVFEDMTDEKVKDLTKVAKDQSADVLQKFLDLVPENLTVHAVQLVSTPEIGIMSEAEKCDADLIVMGRRGSHSLSEQLLGSASTYVLAHAKCPVLVAHNPKNGPYHQILVPVDGSKESLEALKTALRLSQVDDATITALHVSNMRDLIAEETALDQKKKGLEDLGDRLRRNAKDVFERCRQALPADVKVHYVAQIGRPGPTILKEAEQTHTDLIIMGSRGRTGLKSLLLGSVSRYVTGHSLLPVMIVKAGEE
ncbi:universal stress protein [uncultured Megasphaera sp.]|uniref:universal stress protein n=1 Tax=uncultured Megasphaera sp. TaxID=165188 RepID=UPI00286942E2|nr:universal stress protein [uncultured Megasphaera sp.]